MVVKGEARNVKAGTAQKPSLKAIGLLGALQEAVIKTVPDYLTTKFKPTVENLVNGAKGRVARRK